MQKYRRAVAGRRVRHALKEGPVTARGGRGHVVERGAIPLSPEAALAEKIRRANEGRKRINGHSAEYVADHLGIPVTEAFPPNGETVYVGDPWQKLDRKGVVIVDYEFGPVAEFQSDREVYLRVLESRLADIITCLSLTHDQDIQIFLEKECAFAQKLYTEARMKPITEYERISNEFLELKQRIEAEIERETGGKENDPIHALSWLVRDLWYVAVHGARAVDVLDWATELDEPYRKFADGLPETVTEKAREKKLQDKRRELIEKIRFEKTAQESEVVQALFPFLPFTDERFDRFIAFWSISTYMFEHVTQDELTKYWEEIYRLLKPDGKAYIAPLFGNAIELEQSLTAFARLHADFIFEFDNVEQPNRLLITKQAEQHD